MQYILPLLMLYTHTNVCYKQVAKTKEWNLEDPDTWLRMCRSDLKVGIIIVCVVRTALSLHSRSCISFHHVHPFVVLLAFSDVIYTYVYIELIDEQQQ